MTLRGGFRDNARVAEVIQSRLRFESPLLRIVDVCCRAERGGCGGEETTSAHSIAFPRRGVFVKHQHRVETVADAHCALFFNADDAYRVSHPLHGGDDCLSLHFRDDVLRSGLEAFAPRPAEDPRRPFSQTHGPLGKVGYARRRAMEAALDASDDALVVEERAMRLLEAVISESFAARGVRPQRQRHDTAAAHRAWAEEARLLLNRNLAQRVRLAELARQVHCSPFHLVRVFRAHTGAPIHRYLMRLRLRAAVERLRDGADDLTSLALDLGFSSHAHFSDAFRREMGETPTKVRSSKFEVRRRQSIRQ